MLDSDQLLATIETVTQRTVTSSEFASDCLSLRRNQTVAIERVRFRLGVLVRHTGIKWRRRFNPAAGCHSGSCSRAGSYVAYQSVSRSSRWTARSGSPML